MHLKSVLLFEAYQQRLLVDYAESVLYPVHKEQMDEKRPKLVYYQNWVRATHSLRVARRITLREGRDVELLEMLGVFVASVLDSDIINNQTEENGTGSMGEETTSVLCLHATVLGEMLDEYVAGQRASLGKTIHAFADLNQSVSFVDEGLELVLLHDADGDSHVLVIINGSV
jgi:hypothetical protein